MYRTITQQAVKIVLVTCLGEVIWISPSYAYFDPGTGNILLQGILAAFIGFIVFFQNIKLRIKHYFQQRNKPLKKHNNNGKDAE
jgi:hypothetical protein